MRYHHKQEKQVTVYDGNFSGRNLRGEIACFFETSPSVVIFVVVNVPPMKGRKAGKKLHSIVKIFFLLVISPHGDKSPTQKEEPKPIHHPHHHLIGKMNTTSLRQWLSILISISLSSESQKSFLDAFSHLYKRVYPSVDHAQVEILKNRLFCCFTVCYME